MEFFKKDWSNVTEYSNYFLSTDDFANYWKFLNPPDTPESIAGYAYIIPPVKYSVPLYLPMICKKFTVEGARAYESQKA